ncbi:hypothetical protein D2E70_16275 [Mycobacteroides abscessus]|uniref:hypothetical protein n=1 Tax=Mycobacteroides abscessus TaxID=36809 RepID=UPI000E68F38D|nr:hypothetical protein [Mycobacteroides abscessus]RIS67528.1 hypothetical protein D2E70_16275 [Mycobacteroides abscessus]
MTDKISIKNKATVDAGIKDFGTQKEAVTSIGTDLKAEFDALTTALGITVDGESAEGEVPTGLGDAAKSRADAAATSLGTLATGWQTWVNGAEVIQEEGGTAVQQSDGSTPSKTADPKPTTPQATPYSTSGGSTGGASPYPAAK